jgi:predicted solute-binding protein
MSIPRISASSYSNTAPLIWSFLYGQNHGKFELILDNAPARSAELLSQKRVDAALVPVIEYQRIEDVLLVPDVCVGAKERVRSVCLVTKGEDLRDAKSVALDVSSKTSVALTKIIFREFLGFEPTYKNAKPNLSEMLVHSDCALWMTNAEKAEMAKTINFAAARDEGLTHLDEIISNYEAEIPLVREDFKKYLSRNVSYSIDKNMQSGLQLFFELARKHRLTEKLKSLTFL